MHIFLWGNVPMLAFLGFDLFNRDEFFYVLEILHCPLCYALSFHV